MSHCRTFEEKLPAYLEGAGSEGERREIEKHLAACGNCRAVLQDLKKTGAILAGLEEQESPPWFSQRVMARVREEARPPRGLIRKLFFPLRIKIPLEVMASLLVAVLAWHVYQASPPEMKALPEAPSAPLLLPQQSVTKDAEKEVPAGAPSSVKGKTEPGSSEARPADQAESGGGRAGEVKKQEETIPAMGGRLVEAPASEEKKAPAADRADAARPAMAPLPESAPAEAKPAPAPVFQAAPRKMERELKEKDELQKLEVFRDKARVMGKAAPEMPQQVLTVRVREVDPALKTIRELLLRMGAENIREERSAGRKIVSGRIGAGDLDGLADQLKALGEVSPKEVQSQIDGKTVLIRIVIIPAVP